MSSILSSQGVVLATAMAVSGTVILLAIRLQNQKSPSSSSTTDFSLHISQTLPPSCIISSDEGKKREKKKRKKKVHFAEDVVDPIGNSDEYRKLHSNNIAKAHTNGNNKYSNSYTLKKSGKVREMPANRVALYNGILKDRVLHRVTYSC